MNLFGFMQYNTCFFNENFGSRYLAKNSGVISHHTSTHCTFAMCPSRCKSSQFASYNFGPMRKLRCSTLSSSRTKVAVSPSLQCAWDADDFSKHRRWTTWTSSRSIVPHSRPRMALRIFSEASERFPPAEIMLYVVTHTHGQSLGGNALYFDS